MGLFLRWLRAKTRRAPILDEFRAARALERARARVCAAGRRLPILSSNARAPPRRRGCPRAAMAGISEDPQGPALRLALAAALTVIVLRGSLLEDPHRLLCAAVASVLVVEWVGCGRRWHAWLCGSGLAKYCAATRRAFPCDRRGFGDDHDRLWGCVRCRPCPWRAWTLCSSS